MNKLQQHIHAALCEAARLNDGSNAMRQLFGDLKALHQRVNTRQRQAPPSPAFFSCCPPCCAIARNLRCVALRSPL
jgi:hypothetical protein